MRRLALFAALLPLSGAGAQAPVVPAPVCVRAEVVPGFEGFGKAAPGAPAVGKAAAVTLTIVDASATAPMPHAPKPGTFLGGFPVSIAKAGTYRIALSHGAWIDVVGPNGAATSTAHAHGPACSGIAKIVSFDLTPGTWQLQVSDAKGPNLAVMVVAGG